MNLENIQSISGKTQCTETRLNHKARDLVAYTPSTTSKTPNIIADNSRPVVILQFDKGPATSVARLRGEGGRGVGGCLRRTLACMQRERENANVFEKGFINHKKTQKEKFFPFLLEGMVVGFHKPTKQAVECRSLSPPITMCGSA